MYYQVLILNIANWQKSGSNHLNIFPELKYSSIALAPAVLKNVCLGGNPCAGQGRVPDYPRGIVAVVARRVCSVLCPINKICAITGPDR